MGILYLLFLASLKIAIGLLGGFLLLCFCVFVFLNLSREVKNERIYRIR